MHLLDIGCATGDFLYFARDIFGDMELNGMDVMQDLLEEIDFYANKYLGSIANIDELPKDRFDIVTMLGVVSIFDDFVPILDNALSLLDDNGMLYLFSAFNPEKLDVLIKSRPSSLKRVDESDWECGWNLFSINSIELYCKQKELQCEFLPFKIDLEIPKDVNDPLRSWTIKHNDEYMIINGLQLIHNFYLCKIKKKYRD